MANREREDNIYYARLAEQGERYEDMIRYMKEVSAVSRQIYNSEGGLSRTSDSNHDRKSVVGCCESKFEISEGPYFKIPSSYSSLFLLHV